MPAGPHQENRPLTSIRGLAATWVFVAHTSVAFWKYLPPGLGDNVICGWLGVDIFFVLSGFILAEVYAGLRPRQVVTFWLRRVFRLFPLNTFVLAVVALISLAGFRFVTADWPHVLWHLFMLQSFVPGHKSGWIFVNWSVGVELVCYVGFPAVIMTMARLDRAWLLIAALVVGMACWWGETQVLGQFFGWPALQRGACGFLLGMVTGALSLRCRQLSGWEAGFLEGAGFAGIVYGALGGAGALWCTTPGSWQMALVPVSAAILIAGLGADKGPFARLLRTTPLFWIGRVSYSIYMLHMLVINSTRPSVLWLTGGHPRLRYIAVWAVCAYIITNLFAALTYLFIEQPGRRFGNMVIGRLHDGLPIWNGRNGALLGSSDAFAAWKRKD
jgi:peptidoglycan/LPS O-acetylase OafA/YrhL